jgi:hypothetical protein
MNSGSSGESAATPNSVVTAMRMVPRGIAASSSTSVSTAAPSTMMRVARSTHRRPLSVRLSWRVVRWNKVVRIRSSSRVTALETVVLAMPDPPPPG